MSPRSACWPKWLRGSAARRRRKPAGALPRTRAGVQCGPAQLCAGPASAEQGDRSTRRSRSAAGHRAAQSRACAASRRRFCRSSARVDEAIELYRSVLADYPRQAKVWMSFGHALKTAGRQAECVDAYRKSIELAPSARRGLLEPREPEDVPVFACRGRGDAGAVATHRSRRRRPAALSFRARQGAGGRARVRGFVRALRDGQPAATRRHCVTKRRRPRRPSCGAARPCSRAEFFAQRAGFGTHGPDPDFHRRVAAGRIDARRADPVESLAVEGTMELPDIVGIVRELERLDEMVASASKYPESSPTSTPTRCAPSANATCARPGSSARPRRPSSSTSCRTTGRTSA